MLTLLYTHRVNDFSNGLLNSLHSFFVYFLIHMFIKNFMLIRKIILIIAISQVLSKQIRKEENFSKTHTHKQVLS
jgi:hypothetical protein